MQGRGWKIALAFVAAAAASIFPASASADPSVWTKAREPRLVQEGELVREAQRAILRYRRMARSLGPQGSSLAEMLLRDARRSLAQVVNAGTRDFGVRMLYVEVLRDSKMPDDALAAVKKLLADDPPAPVKADALTELALLHAHAGRRDEEIKAYTDALAIEPHAAARSHLIANRAEALMALGDVTAAVAGYREALAPLTTAELFWIGPTALFGLGVALDRLGNLDDAFRSVKLARSYDPTDKGLRKEAWFFSPAHDEHWYFALGAWTCARFSEGWAVRADCFAESVTRWEEYIAAAPPDDRWVPLARVRLAAVNKERDDFEKRFDAWRKSQKAAAGPGQFRGARPGGPAP
jgi:tetratricopeptide (TPR) repeat protein